MVQLSVAALADYCDVIVVAAAADRLDEMRELLGSGVHVVVGGADRQSSVAAALAAIPADCDIVLVHDAARPLVPASLITRVLASLADGADAVVPGLHVADTIKVVDDRWRRCAHSRARFAAGHPDATGVSP